MFNLKNWLEEAVANVNPFDNGATAATVSAARNKPAPAQTRSAPRPAQQAQQFHPTQIKPLSLSSLHSTQPPKPQLMQPKPQQQSTGPSLGDVANFFVGGTAKLANTAAGGVALAGNALAQGADQVVNQGRNAKVYQKQAQGINNTLLRPGAGLLGQGGAMDQHQFATAAPQVALGKGVASGAETAGELYGPSKGMQLASKALPLGQKVTRGLTEGTLTGLAGNAGSQLLNTGTINPFELGASGLASGLLGGGIPVAARGAKVGSKLLANNAVKAYNSPEHGFVKVPGGGTAGDPKSVAGILKDANVNVTTPPDGKNIYVKGSKAQSKQYNVPVSTPETRRVPINVTQPRGNRMTKYVATNTLDNNGKPTYDLIPMDNKKHTLNNGMVTDKKGKPIGSFLGVDGHGQQYAYVEGRPVNITGITGNLDQWGNKNSAFTDMNRLIEQNAPDKNTARKVQDFTTLYKDKQEAMMKTDLVQRRNELGAKEKAINEALPSGIGKKELSGDLFRAAEGKSDMNQLRQRYGDKFIDEHFVPTLKWSRDTYDNMLGRTNNVLKRNGFDPIPKRSNYITHIQEDPTFWEKAGIGIQDINPLGSSIESDINPGKTRGGIPDEIVGNTANTGARRKFNQFAQKRVGKSSRQDFFAAHDAYYEPMLHNEYMTPAASRARVVEKAFRTNDKAKQLQQDEFAQIVGTDEASKKFNVKNNHPNYKAGRKSPLVMAWQEYGNMLAGKTNAIDRTLIDHGFGKGVDVSNKLQGITGASTIPGSATAAVAQVLSLPQTIARDSAGSVLRAAKDMLTFEGKRAGQNDPLRQSAFMRARYTDASSQRRSTMRKYTHAASKPMEGIERTTGELSWRSAYHEALKKGLKGQDAINKADLEAKKTLAGRGIGDRPMVMNSKALGAVTQFGLEVNNMRIQFFNEFTPAQKVKFMVAAAALNTAYNSLTGQSPLPDYIGAGAQTASDFANSNDDKKDTPGDNALQGAQRVLGETSKWIPGASTLASLMMSDTQRQQVFGKNGDLSRYGTPPLAKGVTTAATAAGDIGKGNLPGALQSLLTLAPTGNQLNRSLQGAQAMNQGYVASPSGDVQSVTNPNDPLQWAHALTFGKNALPGQQSANDSGLKLSPKESTQFQTLLGQDRQKAVDFFNTIMKNKVDTSKRAGSLTMNGQTPTAAAASGPAMTATSIQLDNKLRADKLKASLSPDDYALTQLSQADRAKLMKAGGVTQAKLNGLDSYVASKKKELGYTTTSTTQTNADKYKKAQDDQQTNGSTWSPVEKAKKSNELAKLAVQKDYNNDTVDLYGMSKADVYNLVSKDNNGKKMVDDILKYGDSLVKAGIDKTNKFRDKSGNVSLNAPGTKTSSGKGKSKKGKFDYKLFGFKASASNSKQLHDLLKKAQITRTKKK